MISKKRLGLTCEPRRWFANRFAASLAAASVLSGCSGRDEPQINRANLLLITIDTLRADHCSSYGYQLPTTPNLDALAREGIRFESTYAPMPVTGPTHATILTSLVPLSHGVISNGRVLTDRATTLAEVLSRDGYRAAGIVSSYPLKNHFGFSQGFTHFDDEFPVESSSIPLPQWEGEPLGEPYDRRADETTHRATRWLDEAQRESEPFFLWIHYFDPHSPYDPPEPYRSLFRPAAPDAGEEVERKAAYDGEIRFTDHEIGRLLQALNVRGLDADTLVVLTSDHGEGLSQHGHLEHGRAVYEEAVRVPLILRWPGTIPANAVWPDPVELVDLFPTVLDLLEISREGMDIQGRSLASVIREGMVTDSQREIFFQSEYDPNGPNQSGVRQGQWKYIAKQKRRGSTSAELFDLEQDPLELSSVADQHPDVLRELSRILKDWRRQLPPPNEADPPLTKQDVEALKALGYVK